MSKWIQKEVDKQLEKIEDNKEENHKKIVEKYFESPTQNKTIKMWKISSFCFWQTCAQRNLRS